MAAYDAGIVTAYGAAVQGGYTGTYEQFCNQQAHFADYAAQAQEAAQTAETVANLSIADEYSSSSTYVVGDMCMHEGQLYECSTAISTAEAWTAAHWTAKTVADEVSSLKGGLTDARTDIGDLSNLETTEKSNLVAAINEAAESGGAVDSVNGQTGTVVLDAEDVGAANVIINSASGNFVNIDDSTASNAENVLCYINPVQVGSGEPSSQNIRAISGHTGITVTRAGENLINEDSVFAEYFTKNADGGWDYAKSNYSSVYGTHIYNPQNTDRIAVTFKCKYSRSDKTGLYLKIVYTNNTSDNVINTTVISNASKTVDHVEWVYSTNFTTVKTNDIHIQINKYSSVSDKTVSWQEDAGTVYGGTMNMTTGVLTVTDGYIASYNGETLPSAWISDRDVYEEGASPTTGAQVVYKLDTAVTYDLTPQEISLLVGQNNIWHSANGQTVVTYNADTKTYIDNNGANASGITMYITPEMFGAKGDGVTDDRTAIIDALDEAYKSSKTVLFQNSYYSGSSIVVEDVPNIEMIGTLKFNNSGNGLTLGKASASLTERSIRINLSCDTQTAASGYFGLKILNAINCIINIDSIKGFCYGFIIAGDTRGCAYNTVNINTISSVAKSMIMERTDENSFNSENLFIGGRFVQSGSDDIAIEVQGSNNVFIAPCMEYAEHSLVFIYANKNKIISCRTEHSTYAAKFVGTCDFNDIEVGYGSYAIDGFLNLNSITYNDITAMDAVGSKVSGQYINTVYDAGFLASKFTFSNSKWSLESPLWCLSSGSLYRSNIDSSYFARVGNEISMFGGCIGVMVDCSLTKEFAILQNGSGTGKVTIKLYDANGDQLDMSSIDIGPFTDYRVDQGGIITYGNYAFSVVLLPSDAKKAFIGFSPITDTSLITFAIRSRTMTFSLPE